MDNFIDPSTYKHFLFMNGEKIEAEIAFQVLYSLANKSIYIIDDYIDLRTLHLLKCVNKNIKITIFSDNVSRNNVSEEDIAQFEKEYGIGLEIKPTNNIIHDRYIVLDYDTPNEKTYNNPTVTKKLVPFASLALGHVPHHHTFAVDGGSGRGMEPD